MLPYSRFWYTVSSLSLHPSLGHSSVPALAVEPVFRPPITPSSQAPIPFISHTHLPAPLLISFMISLAPSLCLSTYIGQTRCRQAVRFAEHIRYIRLGYYIPVSRHFHTAGHLLPHHLSVFRLHLQRLSSTPINILTSFF